MADNVKTLQRGQTTIRARDTSPDTLTVDVTDTVVTTTSRSFARVSAACPTQDYFNTLPDSETAFEDAYQFFRVRDSVDSVEEDPLNYELQTLTASSFSDSESLVLYLRGPILFASGVQPYTDTDPVPRLSNSAFSSFYGEQTVGASQALYLADNLDFGNASLDFDGSDDFYVIEPSGNMLPTIGSQENFFIEIIVQLDTIAGDQALYAQYINAAGNGSFLLHYNAGFKVELVSDGTLGDVTLTTAAASVDTLYHLVVQRIGNNFYLYLNGNLEDSVNEAGSREILTTGSLLAAHDTGGATFDGTPGNYLDGKVAKFSLDEAGSASQSFQTFNVRYKDSIEFTALDTNILNFYDARISPWVTTSSNVNYMGDLSGVSSTTQVSTSTAYRPTFTENFYNGHSVLTFDGSLDYFELENVVLPIALNGGAFTITSLVRPTSTSGVDYIHSFNTDTGGNRFIMGYNASTDRFVLFDQASSTTYDSANTFVHNEWYLLTIQFGGPGTNYKLYVDGVLEIDQTLTAGLEGSDRYLFGAELDAVTTPSDFFLGQMAFHAMAASNNEFYRRFFEGYAIGAFQNPEDLAGATAVFEADTPGVVYTNGDPVTDWNDLTANANHATQGTVSAQPSYTDPALNGLPAMTFDGGDSLIIPTAFANTAGSDLTVIAFVENTSGTAGTILTTEENLDEGFSFGFDASNDLLYDHGGFAPQVISDFGLTSPEPVGAKRDSLDAQVSRNAKFWDITTIAGFTASTDLNTYIGNSSIQPGFTGNLYELAIFERLLSEGEAIGISYGYDLKYNNFAVAQPVIANKVFEFDAIAEVGFVDNDTMPTLTDQSATGDATQGTASSRATYRSSLIANQPTVFFDSTDFYTTATTPNVGAGVRTVAFVGCPYRLGGDSIAFSWGPTGTAGEAFTLYYDGIDELWYLTDNMTSWSFGKPTYTMETLIASYDGTILSLYKNGALVLKTNATLATVTGTELTIGDDNLGANSLDRFHGWMSHVLVANTAITSEQAYDYHAYLARRFKLAL